MQILIIKYQNKFMKVRQNYYSEEIRNKNFKEYRDSGKMKDSQRKIFDILKQYGELTNEQMAEILNVPLHHISGRVSELVRQYGLVEFSRYGKSKYNNRKICVWKLTNLAEAKQLSLIS